MSALNWRLNAQLYTALSTTDTVIGICLGHNGDLTTVGFGTYLDGDDSVRSTVDVKSATRYRPAIGEGVVLTWTNGQLKLTGPARARASDGVVTAVNNPHVTVTVEGQQYVMPFAVSVADDLAPGKAVAIDWTYRRGYVKDVLSTVDDDDDVPKLTTDQRPFTLHFFAKQSGSYKDSKWWTQDVIANNNNNNGAWFYGNVIRKSLRNDAYIASVEVYLPLRSTKGGLPKIGRHTQDTRPGNGDSLSVQDAANRKKRSGWVTLPTEWAETWRDNPGGVAVDDSTDNGSNTYKGIQADRQSGKLRIRGRQ